jgi:hypothetical protein
LLVRARLTSVREFVSRSSSFLSDQSNPKVSYSRREYHQSIGQIKSKLLLFAYITLPQGMDWVDGVIGEKGSRSGSKLLDKPKGNGRKVCHSSVIKLTWDVTIPRLPIRDRFLNTSLSFICCTIAGKFKFYAISCGDSLDALSPIAPSLSQSTQKRWASHPPHKLDRL